jgi:hypothetical protein
MSEMWDTFGLFQKLLDNFKNLLTRARDLRTTNPEDTQAVKAAVIGFSLFLPITAWSYEHYLLVDNRLQGELSLEAVKGYVVLPEEDCAQAYVVFACLAIGALIGKFNAGEIDEAGAFLGEAHLVSFIAQHIKEICTQYNT